MTWEYYFQFDCGMPPWTSAMSQGTALQALAAAYKATGNTAYLSIGSRALTVFTVAPPVGVAVWTRLDTRGGGLGGVKPSAWPTAGADPSGHPDSASNLSHVWAVRST